MSVQDVESRKKGTGIRIRLSWMMERTGGSKVGKLERSQCHEESGAGRRVDRARESNFSKVWWWWSVRRGVRGLVWILHHAQMVVFTGRREGVERESKDRMSGCKDGGGETDEM